MPVLVEAISVIVRRDAIARGGPAARDRFLSLIPNQTFCEDEHLARVGFMHPQDVEGFIHRLQTLGLTFLGPDGQARDIAVADQVRGLTSPCDWLEVYGIVHFESGADIRCARLVGDTSYTVALPAGWDWEHSLSKERHFVASEDAPGTLVLLRRDPTLDVSLDLRTGRELYAGRSSGGRGFVVNWVEAPATLAAAAEGGTLPRIPLFSDGRIPEPPGGPLHPVAIVLGALLAGESGPGTLSESQLAEIVRATAGQLRAESVDDAIASACGYIREEHGLEPAIRAARRVLALLPDSVTTRGDLIVALVTLATVRTQDPKPLLEEAAREFRQWFRQTPAGTADFAVTLWAGLSALGYLGCAMERRSLLDRGWVGWALSSGLDDAARAVQPGDLTVIRSVLAELYGQDPTRARAGLGR